MKNTIFLLFLFLFTWLAHAEEYHTITTSAGNLESDAVTFLSSVTHLTVKGTLDGTDFTTIRTKMTNLVLLDLSDVNISTIPSNAFQEMSAMSQLVFPKTVTRIGIRAFSGNTGLKTVEFPPKLAYIDHDAFNGSKISGTLVLPLSLKEIGDWAFLNCKYLTGSLVVPDSVKLIGYQSFSWCTGLNGTLTLPKNIWEIGTSAFHNDTNLIGNLVLPPKANIKLGAFKLCKRLSGTLVLPPISYGVANNVFEDCIGFNSLILPKEVISLGPAAFKNCSGLTSIYCYRAKPPTLYKEAFFGLKKTTCELHVPIGTKDAYAAAYQWMEFTNVIDDLTNIPEVTTQDVSTIGSITATANGTIVDLGAPFLTQHGFVWSTNPDPTLEKGIKSENGTATTTKTFTSTLRNLTPKTTYYIKTYAINSLDTVYGTQVEFTTTTPIITLSAADTISMSTTLETVSIPKTFTISGSKLIAGITLVAPKGFEIRVNNSGVFDSTLTLASSAGSVSSKIIEVRIRNTAKAAIWSDSILCTSPFAEVKHVHLKGTVPRVQLSISNPSVVLKKMVDGSSNAIVKQIGALSGVIASDMNNVQVLPVANYDNAEVGVNKTITVSYVLTGSAKDNYIKPIDFVFTNAVIIDSTRLDSLWTTSGCEGSLLELNYKVVSGRPLKYSLTFDDDTNANGLGNIAFSSIPDANTYGVIPIYLPEEMPDGTYHGLLKIKNEFDIESADYPFEFTVNVSSKNIVTKYDILLIFNNSNHRFSGFQWIKNGKVITGATKQFYEDPAGLKGSYSLKLKTVNGQTLFTCPKYLNLKKQSNIGLFPNPIKINTSRTVRLYGLKNSELQNANLKIYDTSGKCIFENQPSESPFELPLKAGLYMGHLRTKENEYYFKISANE